MAYQKQIYQDGVTEYTEELFEHMDDGIFGAYPVQLIAISDTAPSQCVENDKYYNTSTKKIYTATGTNTWGTNGETPLEDTSYWLISENGNYAWDGTDLVSIGGGKAEVVISDEEPEEGKLWVDTAEIPTIAGRDRLVNVSNEVDEDYRVNVLKSKNLFDEILEIGGFDGNGINIAVSTRLRCKNYIPVKPNTTYSVSYTKVSSDLKISISYYNKNDYTTARLSNSDWFTATTFTITTPANCNYLRFVVGLTNDGSISSTNIISNVMINEGSLALPYEPYVVPSLNVDGEEIYSKELLDNATAFMTKVGDRLYTKFKNSGTSQSITITVGNIDRETYLIMGVNNSVGSILSLITSSSSTTNVKNLGTVSLSVSRSGSNITVSGLGTQYTYVLVISYDSFTIA